MNPFVTGGTTPLDKFVGREHEIKVILERITQRQKGHVAIYGLSGVGKTSLLRLLMETVTWEQRGHSIAKFYCVYIDCKTIHPFAPAAFWRMLAEQLEYVADINLKARTSELLKQPEVSRDDIIQLVLCVGQQGKHLLLLIDTYDDALSFNHSQCTESDISSFLSQMRSLAFDSRITKSIASVVVSSRPLNEISPILNSPSPWYNHFQFIPLKPFLKDEIEKYFFQSSSKLYIPAESCFRKVIISVTGGHPALLQIAGAVIYELHQTNRYLNFENFRKEFQQQAEHVFHQIWRSSTESEQVLMMLVALNSLDKRTSVRRKYTLKGVEQIFSQKRKELGDLEYGGIIISQDIAGKPCPYIASSMMEWWIINEIENSNIEELKRREKVLLSLMSRYQIGQLEKVVQQIWAHREAAKSMLEWMATLATG